VSANQRQAEPEFPPNEFYETLLRIKRDQPRRYSSNVSAGTQRRVELYEERKAHAAAHGSSTRKARAA
jgi:hypothetical protein